MRSDRWRRPDELCRAGGLPFDHTLARRIDDQPARHRRVACRQRNGAASCGPGGSRGPARGACRRLGRHRRRPRWRRDSIFRLASITKPITAAAVMMLVEDGRIALDEPVDKRLPDWRPRRSSVHPRARSTTLYRPPGRSPCSICSPAAREFLAEPLFEPLGMIDTGFEVPPPTYRFTRLLPARLGRRSRAR